MKDARLRAGLRTVGRVFRWRPQSYKQAWLFAVVVAAAVLVIFVIMAALYNWPQSWPISAFVAFAVTLMIQGLGSSYDLRRRDRR